MTTFFFFVPQNPKMSSCICKVELQCFKNVLVNPEKPKTPAYLETEGTNSKHSTDPAVIQLLGVFDHLMNPTLIFTLVEIFGSTAHQSNFCR